jgi:hypothetical protein
MIDKKPCLLDAFSGGALSMAVFCFIVLHDIGTFIKR